MLVDVHSPTCMYPRAMCCAGRQSHACRRSGNDSAVVPLPVVARPCSCQPESACPSRSNHWDPALGVAGNTDRSSRTDSPSGPRPTPQVLRSSSPRICFFLAVLHYYMLGTKSPFVAYQAQTVPAVLGFFIFLAEYRPSLFRHHRSSFADDPQVGKLLLDVRHLEDGEVPPGFLADLR